MDTRSACLLAPVSSAVAAVRWQGWQVARIALIGDSQLTDTSSQDVTKLGPRLRRRGHEVETLALGGLNTREAVAVASDVGHVEWTVYCLGANDAAPWKRVPLKEFGMNYQTLLLRSTGARQLVLGPAPVIETGVPRVRTNLSLRGTQPRPPTWRATAAPSSFHCSPSSALMISPTTACTSTITVTTRSSALWSRRSNSGSTVRPIQAGLDLCSTVSSSPARLRSCFTGRRRRSAHWPCPPAGSRSGCRDRRGRRDSSPGSAARKR